MLRRILIIMSLLVVAAAWAGCGGLPKSAVAEVNGKVITQEDLDQAIEQARQSYGETSVPAEGTQEYKDFEKQIVKRLVDEQIVWFEAENMGITVTAEEVESELEKAEMQAGGEEQLQDILDQSNITLDRFKESLRDNLMFQKLFPEVTKDAPEVTDEQARDFYDENPEQFQAPEQRTVSHILVKTPEEAQAVKQRLASGEDFATVAREVSTDPGSKDNGGSLGQVPSEGSGFVPEFEAAMNQLQPGQISDPVQSQLGYHIIKVESITPAGMQTFEEVLEDLKMGLMIEVQRQVFDEWLNNVRGNYEITYSDEFRPDDMTTETATTGAPAAGAAGE